MSTFVFSDGQTFALLAWVDFFRSTSTGNVTAMCALIEQSYCHLSVCLCPTGSLGTIIYYKYELVNTIRVCLG